MTNYRLSEYDRQRIEEMKRANLAGFWLVFAALAGVALVLLAINGGL
ncbi:hypothetical protein OG381_34285 [Streptomyces sp. NBC_00490]